MPRFALLCLTLFAVACTTSTTAASTSCKSGSVWTGGEVSGESMHPGGDCNACHASGGKGPQFAIAGTVYLPTASADADDCLGASGAKIVITKPDGTVAATLTSNSSGNFTLRSGTIPKPYKAYVEYNGKKREMMGAQAIGSCNSCHTITGANGAPTGANGAPGRILLPD